jgi:hypothetical protein
VSAEADVRPVQSKNLFEERTVPEPRTVYYRMRG